MNRQRFTQLFGALMVVMALWSISCSKQPQGSRATESAMTTINKSKVIVAGWAPYAPYCSVNLQTKRPQGFYIDLFEAMAKEAGLEVKWVETTWSTMIVDLRVGNFQVMAAPVFRTIPRSMAVAFTRPIDYFGLSAVVRAEDNRFKMVEDFNREGVTIVGTQGEVGHEFAERHLPKAKLIGYKGGDIAKALVDVIDGKADVGICDSWTVRLFVKEHAGKVKDLFSGKPFNPVGAGWYVSPRDAEFLQFLNTSIDWLESSGTIERIARKYELPSFLGK